MNPPRKDSAPSASPLQRFQRSMVIDYEKWHDGIGYDLDALRAASPDELAAIEALLTQPGTRDWRDIEALALLGTAGAEAALRAAMGDPSAEVRAAVSRYAPGLVSERERAASLVEALQTATFFAGLSQTLDQVVECHPPVVLDALLSGALRREGEVAVHFAAMLAYLHGTATAPFDLARRPFFLRFNCTERAARETAFRELCAEIGVAAAPYLDAAATSSS